MRKLMLAAALPALLTGPAFADGHAMDPVKIGIILGFTGPIESLTPGMRDSALLAMQEVTNSGELLDGAKIEAVIADSTCVDAAAATAAAERLVTADGVVAIMGADCSGVTGAIASNVAVPNGVPMISPSATSPALSTIEDNDLFFRTSPSDARQGEVLAAILKEKGIDSIAVTYTNNDYGKGLADSFAAAFEGEVAISAAHEDGKGDYSAEVGALAAAGADTLAVFGYLDQGGKGIVQGALDTGAFDSFVFGDGMIGESIIEAIGEDLEGTIGTVAGSDSEGAETFQSMHTAAGISGDGPYRGESYDAAAVLALAIGAAGSADRAAVQARIIEVANAPGVPIMPGELAWGLRIVQAGQDIDYVGATNVELIGPGEAAGTFKELVVKDGVWDTVRIR